MGGGAIASEAKIKQLGQVQQGEQSVQPKPKFQKFGFFC